MIFTGRRQVGKTYEAITEVVNRCKDGETIGVIAPAKELSRILKERVKKQLSTNGKTNVKVEVIRLHDKCLVDYVLIDELDLVLGNNCVCTTGGVVNLKGIGKDDPNTYTEKTVSDRLNKIVDDVVEKKVQELKESIVKSILEELK